MSELIVRDLGLQAYRSIWKKMQDFTEARDAHSQDEIWFLQHPAVFTQGLNGKPEHLLNTGTIPVVDIDRGGQVTYHGPGQLVVYCLFDLKRNKFGIRQLVTAIETAVINFLSQYDIAAVARKDAPGVYVNDAKICALGLRVKRACCYHGLSINIDMDLSPFEMINPCGYEGLKVTQLKDLNLQLTMADVQMQILQQLMVQLSIKHYQLKNSF